jgi:multicomponent Na+:H+ antiporter subunit A
MLIAIVTAFAAALLVPLIYRAQQQLAMVAAPGAALGLFAYFASQAPAVLGGEPILVSYDWVPGMGVSASFILDGLSLVFALLVTGIGTLIFTYAGAYFHNERDRLGGTLGILLLFMGSMLGVVLADDAITLFVFWELTSISSFFLIGYKFYTEKAKKSALQALVITGAGGLVLLAGLLLLGHAAAQEFAAAGLDPENARRISALAEVDIRGHEYYTAIFILVALGAFSKSAQMPLHFWLPGAMVAPTPISAYLHSATMVKAGTFLLARMNPHLGGTDLWFWTVTIVGAVTMVVAAAFAVFQRDLKRVLAYTTVSALGTLTMLVGIGTERAAEAFALFLIVHALYKAPLFMVAGTIDQQTGTRDPWAIRGLAYRMRGTGAVIALAALSMAAIPPFFGFIAKEEMYGAAFYFNEFEGMPVLIAVATWVTAAFTATAAFVVALPAFSRGPGGPGDKAPSEGPLRMVVAPAILAALGLVLGVTHVFAEGMIGAIASAISGEEIVTSLALWHGIAYPYGVMLLMSAGSLAVAGLLYAKLSSRPPAAESRLGALQGAEIYARFIDGIYKLAGATARVVQGGPLHRHMFIVATVAIAAAATPLILFWEDPPLSGGPFSIPEVLIILLGLASLALILLARNRLVMTAAAGITGFALAFLFAIYSAPDLAITQLMVETLMVILLVLVLHRLPPRVVRHSLPKRLTHAAVALAGGALVTVLLLLATPAQFPADASEFYIRTTPDQHAGNLVNAILENFRAMDTLGEIAVLAIAGVGVAALIRLARDRHGGPDIATSGVAASSPPGWSDGDEGATETSEFATGPDAPAGPTGEPKEPSS